LAMEIGAERQPLRATDDTRMVFAGALDSQPPTPTVTVVVTRGGVQQRSSVTVPAAFSVLSPVGPATLHKSAGQLLVQVSVPATDPVSFATTGTCTRGDLNGNFDVSGISVPALLVGAVPNGSG